MIKQNQIEIFGAGSLININWELVSHCQFKCSYCYYGPHVSKTDYLSVGKLVTKKLLSLNDYAKITLVGGEPTLHPEFHDVVQRLHSNEKIKEINIVTNFEMPLDFWIKLKDYSDKLKIVISFHPEYPQRDAFEKIEALKAHFNLDLVFVVHHNLKFLPKLKSYLDTAKNLDESISVNFVPVHKESIYVNYPDELKDFFKDTQNVLKDRKKTETTSIQVDGKWRDIFKFDVINQKLNYLKGWSCKLRAFIIHEDGMTSASCTNSKKHILLQDFKETTLTCPYTLCECDDYWAFPKTK